jgi:hypothetical protein
VIASTEGRGGDYRAKVPNMPARATMKENCTFAGTLTDSWEIVTVDHCSSGLQLSAILPEADEQVKKKKLLLFSKDEPRLLGVLQRKRSPE